MGRATGVAIEGVNKRKLSRKGGGDKEVSGSSMLIPSVADRFAGKVGIIMLWSALQHSPLCMQTLYNVSVHCVGSNVQGTAFC